MFCGWCLGIWWCHDNWISEKLKFDYLKNGKSFLNEVKNMFPCFTSALTQTYKINYQNVTDTNFKYKLQDGNWIRKFEYSTIMP